MINTKSDLSIYISSSRVYVFFYNFKQNTTSLSLLAGRTVATCNCPCVVDFPYHEFPWVVQKKALGLFLQDLANPASLTWILIVFLSKFF